MGTTKNLLLKILNLLFLIWIFTEAKATIVNVNRKRKQCRRKILKLAKNITLKKENGFHLLALERERPNLFAMVTQFLNAKGFVNLAVGNKRLHKTLSGSLESLKIHLNPEFVTNFPKYFVTYAYFPPFPQEKFVLLYFNFFCRMFGTEPTVKQIWRRDDRNPQKKIRFTTLLKDDKFTKLAYFVEGGKLCYAQEVGGRVKFYKHKENRVPWVISADGIFDAMDFILFPPEVVQKVGNEFVLKFNFPPEITVISYLTPENFNANIRKLPFAEFPGFK